MNKILFITHDCSRTGAPIVLLHFLKWLKNNQPQIKVDVLALREGELSPLFKENSNHFFKYANLNKPKKINPFFRLMNSLGLYKKSDLHNEAIEQIISNNYDLVYANTIQSIPISMEITKGNSLSRLIVHLHELNVIIKQLLPNFNDFINKIDKLIVPSQLVKKNLVNQWLVPIEKIDMIYECSVIPDLNAEYTNESNIFSVGASGTVHWRKGYDIFIQVARYIVKHFPEVKVQFVWVGKIPTAESMILQEDLRKLKLEDSIRFVGELENPTTIYKSLDVFVLPSREDPFPLVAIEAGLLGLPIITFDQATGINEIIQERGGAIVPYLDIEAMAEKIVWYYQNPDKRIAHGNYNQETFQKFTPEKICPQLYDAILNV